MKAITETIGPFSDLLPVASDAAPAVSGRIASVTPCAD